jgi:hypothetical protein
MRPVTRDAVEMRLLGKRYGIGVFARIDAIAIHHNQNQRTWNGGHWMFAPMLSQCLSVSVSQQFGG